MKVKDNVTLIIERVSIDGKEKEFRLALEDIKNAASTAQGFVSHNTESFDNGSKVRIHVTFKDPESVKAWESSESKQKYLEKLNQSSTVKSKYFATSGLETWFINYNGQVKSPPPKHKMAVISWLAVTPLLIGVNILTKPLLEGFSVPVRILCVTPIISILMTYALMPFMAKIFSKWLYPE